MLCWIALALAAPPEPVRLGPAPALGPGAVRLTWAGVELDSLGAAVLTLRPGAPVPAALRAEGQPLGPSERSWRIPCPAGEDALDTAARWARHPAVRSASPDLRLERIPTLGVDDPSAPAQWYLDTLGFDQIFEVSRGDPSIRVAVIDGPIDIDHPDLAPGVHAPYDAVTGGDDPRPVCTDEECDHHGTAAAGIVAARADNGIGIVGLCSACTLVPIRMLGGGAGLSADLAAFEHAIAQDVAVINNSWGYRQPIPVPAPLADIIERAQTEPRGGLGALVVFAAGNEDRRLGSHEVTGVPGVITVSATDRYGFPTPYTNTGPTVDLAAPSATVTLAAGGGVMTDFGGTSAAAPVVSGIAGWAFSVRPDLSAAELAELLVQSARPHRDGGHDERFGWGHLDPPALRDALLGGGDEEPDPPPGGTCGCASGPPGGLLVGLVAGLLVRRRRTH